jgi:hypothetical protein
MLLRAFQKDPITGHQDGPRNRSEKPPEMIVLQIRSCSSLDRLPPDSVDRDLCQNRVYLSIITQKEGQWMDPVVMLACIDHSPAAGQRDRATAHSL